MKYTIPSYKIKSVIKKLDSLNNGIKLREGAPITYTLSAPYEKFVDLINEFDVPVSKLVEMVDLTLDNFVVSLNGWSFLAVTEHSKEGNITMKKIYDVEIPERYYESGTYCEHCNTNRYRKYTYLVYKAETKEIFQVGSSCLQAYLGFDVSLLLEHAKLIDTLNGMFNKEHGRMEKRGIEAQTFETFIKRTIAYINQYGYVSAKKAREDAFLVATGFEVWGVEYNKTHNTDIINGALTQEVDDTFVAVYDWVYGLEDNKSDYVRNIKVLLKRGYVTSKTATTAASIVGVYFANLNKQKVESVDKVTSNHIGTIKERINVTMTLKYVNSFEGKYGISHCYNFLTTEGNIIVWFSNTSNLEIDKTYTGKATVTKHTEYKGIKQTLVNRCTLKEV